MKNISLTINTNTVLQQPTFPSQTTPKVANVSFSVQFEDEAQAVVFASKLLALVSGDNE